MATFEEYFVGGMVHEAYEYGELAFLVYGAGEGGWPFGEGGGLDHGIAGAGAVYGQAFAPRFPGAVCEFLDVFWGSFLGQVGCIRDGVADPALGGGLDLDFG